MKPKVQANSQEIVASPAFSRDGKDLRDFYLYAQIAGFGGVAIHWMAKLNFIALPDIARIITLVFLAICALWWGLTSKATLVPFMAIASPVAIPVIRGQIAPEWLAILLATLWIAVGIVDALFWQNRNKAQSDAASRQLRTSLGLFVFLAGFSLSLSQLEFNSEKPAPQSQARKTAEARTLEEPKFGQSGAGWRVVKLT